MGILQFIWVLENLANDCKDYKKFNKGNNVDVKSSSFELDDEDFDNFVKTMNENG